MIIGRVKEDFKEYCKKIDEKKKIALPIPLFQPRDWQKLGKEIGRLINEYNCRCSNNRNRNI